jgi:macrolide phosphotransferase
VPRSPLALAALATAAVPGLDVVDVRRPRNLSTGVDAAVVIDAEGRRWVVRAPQNPAAGAALEAETALLGELVPHVDDGRLPFAVPRPTAFVDLPEGGRAVVSPQLPGRALRLELLGPGPGLAAEVGRAIAAIHELPPATIEDAGLPVYKADEYRRRRLAEVDEAARTGRVPTTLLRRWERALEDVAMWRFRPVVVHGDLSADHILCLDEHPAAVLGWSEAKVADPADDLAWLLVAAPHEAVDAILEAYNLRRTELRDPHLADRALLAGELALARWLLHGVHTEDEAIVEDATTMLTELAEQTEAEAQAQVVTEAAWTADEEGWGPDDETPAEADEAWAPPSEGDEAETERAETEGAEAEGAEAEGAETEGAPGTDAAEPALATDDAEPGADEPVLVPALVEDEDDAEILEVHLDEDDARD